MLEKGFQQVQSVEADHVPTEEAIQHLVGYIAGLERSANMFSNHQARDESTLELISMAKKIERFHQIKVSSLGDELSALGEPVWKILIQLVIATEEGKNISVADISSRISLPETTALRYLNILESKGYILRPPHQADHFDSHLRLTKQGRSIMSKTLLALNAL